MIKKRFERYKDLPDSIKKLAMNNVKSWKKGKMGSNPPLTSMFSWTDSPEGVWFWAGLREGSLNLLDRSPKKIFKSL